MGIDFKGKKGNVVGELGIGWKVVLDNGFGEVGGDFIGYGKMYLY